MCDKKLFYMLIDKIIDKSSEKKYSNYNDFMDNLGRNFDDIYYDGKEDGKIDFAQELLRFIDENRK